MKYVFQRTLFLVSFILSSAILLTSTASMAAAVEAKPIYSDRPTVWCEYSAEAIARHRELMKELPAVETLTKDFKGTNFAVACLNDRTLSFGDFDALKNVFISNHIHDFEGGMSYDCHRSRGFPKRITDEMKKAQDVLATVSFSTRSEAWFQNGMANLKQLKEKVVAPAELALAKYASFDTLENNYIETYPFPRDSIKKIYPCFDSEASIARFVTLKVKSRELSGEDSLVLRIHSRFNPCFFCVQMLHHYAQVWSETLEKPVYVYVSSHEVYHMPNEIMPEGFVISASIMINYGERVNRELNPTEVNEYTYLPGKAGKIIQTFFRGIPVAEEAVAAGDA